MTDPPQVTPANNIEDACNATEVRADRSGTVSESRSTPVLVTDRRIEMVPVRRLIASKGNARTHSKGQIRQIADSMQRFGFNNPILIDDGDEIIAGHGRVDAAKLLGLNAVPALRLSHLTAAEKRGYVLADNKLAEKAGWDRKILAIELRSLIDLDFEVELTGFELAEVDAILDDGNEAKRESADPKDKVVRPLLGPSVVHAGDLWLLGEHRLLCGDACNGIDVAIKHWQAHTGKHAALAATGQTFEEIERERAKPASRLDGIAQPNATAVRGAS
jgi:ParB-like chromosome segregation protein Spo0J